MAKEGKREIGMSKKVANECKKRVSGSKKGANGRMEGLGITNKVASEGSTR